MKTHKPKKRRGSAYWATLIGAVLTVLFAGALTIELIKLY